jgi:hypothetical protein
MSIMFQLSWAIVVHLIWTAIEGTWDSLFFLYKIILENWIIMGILYLLWVVIPIVIIILSLYYYSIAIKKRD